MTLWLSCVCVCVCVKIIDMSYLTKKSVLSSHFYCLGCYALYIMVFFVSEVYFLVLWSVYHLCVLFQSCAISHIFHCRELVFLCFLLMVTLLPMCFFTHFSLVWRNAPRFRLMASLVTICSPPVLSFSLIFQCRELIFLCSPSVWWYYPHVFFRS